MKRPLTRGQLFLAGVAVLIFDLALITSIAFIIFSVAKAVLGG